MAVIPLIRKASLEDQARTDATKAENAARSRLPVAAAAAAAPVTAPRASPYDNFGAAGVSATAPAAAAPRLPIDFKTAGFTSQSEYDAAKLQPDTTAASGMPNTSSSRLPSASWTAAQDAATAQAAQTRANTLAPMSRETGYALGNAIRSENIAAAEKAALRPAQKPSMAGAQASAAAGQLALAGRIQGQQDAASSYQKQNPVTRESNIADAKRNGTFGADRDKFNTANKETRVMDTDGNVTEYDQATRGKMEAASSKVNYVQLKGAAEQAKAAYEFKNTMLKRLLGEQEAAEAAKKQQPATVGANIAGLFGVAPKPFMMGGTVKAAAPVPRTDWLAQNQGRKPPTQPVAVAPAAPPDGLPAAGRLGGLADWWASR